jgi:hypothetical protein
MVEADIFFERDAFDFVLAAQENGRAQLQFNETRRRADDARLGAFRKNDALWVALQFLVYGFNESHSGGSFGVRGVAGQ